MTMFPCNRRSAILLLLLVVVLSCLDAATARPTPVSRTPPDTLKHLQNAQRGSSVAELKRHLARFGYMPTPSAGDDDGDTFDERLEAAVKRFQSRLGLPVTGQLDDAMQRRIMSPRCGIGDNGHVSSMSLSESDSAPTGRFTFLQGEPRWTRRPDTLTLTYSVSKLAAVDPYLPREAVRDAVRSAFARWARVILVEFVETHDDLRADITVGFHSGEHGDDSPFDGPLGVLGHTTGPNNGRVHLDAEERWTVDLGKETAVNPIDLESVATHEIGHVLGLGHSSSPEAVMYPYLGVRERKVELTGDDVEGVQLLYGSNEEFRHVTSVSAGRMTSSLAGSVSLVCAVFLVMLLTHL